MGKVISETCTVPGDLGMGGFEIGEGVGFAGELTEVLWEAAVGVLDGMPLFIVDELFGVPVDVVLAGV
jgi:hypothetical protein